jgi:hypothetical protein
VEMLHGGQIGRLEHAAVDDQDLISGGDEFLDGSAADEPRAAEEDDLQALSLTVAVLALPFASAPAAPRTECGLRSTIRSMRPHSLACSGVMK